MTTLRSAEDLTAQLHGAFPAMAEEEGRVDVEHVDAATIRIRMRAADRHLRPGATVSGPALFSLVDSVAWLMTLAHLEPGRDALTVSASVQFLRRPTAGTLIGEGRLLRMGRRFSVTDVLVHAGDPPAVSGTGPDGDGAAPPGPVVQATVTYAPI